MVLNKSIFRVGLVILLTWPIFVSPARAQDECKPHKRVVKAIQKLFGENLVMAQMGSATDLARESEYFQAGDCLYMLTELDVIRGYLLSTRAKGRFEYFDYSVLFSSDGIVLQVLVTVYRSTYGAAISQKNWLSQFAGYMGGPLELGQDIDAVSGGTLSASSLVKDIQRAHLLLFSQIIE